MAKVDIEAVRKRLAQIGGGRGGGRGDGGGNASKFKRWKYDKPGTFTIRVLPFKNTEPGMPFPEKVVYYGISADGGGMIVSPENAGERDPIKDFRINLYNQAKDAKTPAEADEIKAQAKKLNAKTVNCVAIVDRANEGAGPQMWSPNWADTQALLALFLTDAEDYTDLSNGCDLNLIVTESKKINQRTKKPLLEANITAARKNSPAAKDDATLKSWLETMPDPNEYYPTTSTEETQKRLQAWLDAGEHDRDGDGASRGGEPTRREADEPKPAEPAKAAERKPAPKPPAVKKPSIIQDVDDDLDQALNDLEG